MGRQLASWHDDVWYGVSLCFSCVDLYLFSYFSPLFFVQCNFCLNIQCWGPEMGKTKLRFGGGKRLMAAFVPKVCEEVRMSKEELWQPIW